MTKPRKHDRADTKFANSAILTGMPALSRTAKSPVGKIKQQSQFRNLLQEIRISVIQ